MERISEGRLDVGPVTLGYLSGGNAEKGTIVFSHALYFDKSLFRHQLEYFARDYHVIAYDHRAHGVSGAASDGRYDVEALSEDAIALIERLDVGPVHFVGNSLGGFIALRLAARRPDLLRSAIALGSSGDEEENVERLVPLYDHLLVHGGRGAEEAVLGLMFAPATVANEAFAGEREKWRAHFSALQPLIARPAAGVMFRGGINRSLSLSPTPILAIAGDDDVVYPERLSEAIAAAAPRGEWTTIPLAGHCVALEQPDAANAVIADFFERVS